MSAGHNSGRILEVQVVGYAKGAVPCPLDTIITFAMRSLGGVPVSKAWIVCTLEANGFRIANEGETLLVEKVEPSSNTG